MKARIKDYVQTIDRKQILTIVLDGDFSGQYDELKDVDIEIDIKKYRKKRSLDANAYLWVLIGKLSEKIGIDPIEIYRQYVRDLGISRLIEISESAVETMRISWGLHGKGWFCDVLDDGAHEGTKLMRLFYGSSSYNTKQMGMLIDLVCEDCKQNNIEVMTPDELAVMKARWGS